MTLNVKIGFFWFFDDFALRHRSVEFTRSRHSTILCALQYDYNKGILFHPKFSRCTISLYCECNNLLFSTFMMHSIWWNGLHRPILERNLWYFVRWCCHLRNRFTTPILVLGIVKHLYYSHAQPSAHNADRLHWLSCYIFTRESSYCFHRVLVIAILSLWLSVCLFVCPSDRHTGGTR